MTTISRMTTNNMWLKPLELDALDGSLGRRLLSSRLQGRAGHAASDGRELNIAGGEGIYELSESTHLTVYSDCFCFSILQRSLLNFHFPFLIITNLFHLHKCKLGKHPPLPHSYWQQNSFEQCDTWIERLFNRAIFKRMAQEQPWLERMEQLSEQNIARKGLFRHSLLHVWWKRHTVPVINCQESYLRPAVLQKADMMIRSLWSQSMWD